MWIASGTGHSSHDVLLGSGTVLLMMMSERLNLRSCEFAARAKCQLNLDALDIG